MVRVVCLDCNFIWKSKHLDRTYRCPKCGGTDIGELMFGKAGHKR